MTDGKMITIADRTILMAKLLGILTITALFLMVFARQGFAAASSDKNMNMNMSSEQTLSGKIVSTDPGNEVFMVQSDQLGRTKPNNELHVFTMGSTRIQSCNGGTGSLNDLSGNNVKITYHELGGLAVADSIAAKC